MDDERWEYLLELVANDWLWDELLEEVYRSCPNASPVQAVNIARDMYKRIIGTSSTGRERIELCDQTVLSNVSGASSQTSAPSQWSSLCSFFCCDFKKSPVDEERAPLLEL